MKYIDRKMIVIKFAPGLTAEVDQLIRRLGTGDMSSKLSSYPAG